jgi:hypothetical protein
MDRNRNRDDVDRENRMNQVPGVRRDDDSGDRSMHGGGRSMNDLPDDGGTRDRPMHGASRDRDGSLGATSPDSSPLQGSDARDGESLEDREMRGSPSRDRVADRPADIPRGSDVDGEMRGGGPDRGGILNDERGGTNRNQTGSNVRDERSGSTGTPSIGSENGA